MGADRLFDMFGKQGGTILIEHLDLRMNHIPGQCVKKLCRLLIIEKITLVRSHFIKQSKAKRNM